MIRVEIKICGFSKLIKNFYCHLLISIWNCHISMECSYQVHLEVRRNNPKFEVFEVWQLKRSFIPNGQFTMWCPMRSDDRHFSWIFWSSIVSRVHLCVRTHKLGENRDPLQSCVHCSICIEHLWSPSHSASTCATSRHPVDSSVHACINSTDRWVNPRCCSDLPRFVMNFIQKWGRNHNRTAWCYISAYSLINFVVSSLHQNWIAMVQCDQLQAIGWLGVYKKLVNLHGS